MGFRDNEFLQHAHLCMNLIQENLKPKTDVYSGGSTTILGSIGMGGSDADLGERNSVKRVFLKV